MPRTAVVRRYYPALSLVVSLDDFPESFGFVTQVQILFDIINNLPNKIF